MQTSSRILFVDDDPYVLDGLRHSLWNRRKQWDMHFAIGGEAAIVRLNREAFDVVVSDMKMPRVDGVAVLKHTHAKHPETLRIGLSGESGEEFALRAAQHAHQSLAKPCPPETLETTLSRAFKIRALVSDPRMRATLGGLRQLPALPRTYTRLSTVLEDRFASMTDVSRIVEGDVAATAKILHLVNSAFFGFGRPVKTILQAVQLLGVDLVKSLVLSTGVFSGVMSPEMAHACEELHIHSVQIAHLASTIAEPSYRRDSFTAGLLHDIGWLVQIKYGPESVTKSMGRRFATATSEADDGELHASLGAYLLGIWGLQLDVIDAVATHHQPIHEPNVSPVARNVRRAEWALRTALAEGTSGLRERAIALASAPPDDVTTG
ncbi:MAG TPA: HDOD domain-containing protein [Labilithrix sp.]|nr:HDOD domain-containing protein [Labilithrix sp.]